METETWNKEFTRRDDKEKLQRFSVAASLVRGAAPDVENKPALRFAQRSGYIMTSRAA
jgi:hypothetical protein